MKNRWNVLDDVFGETMESLFWEVEVEDTGEFEPVTWLEIGTLSRVTRRTVYAHAYLGSGRGFLSLQVVPEDSEPPLVGEIPIEE